MVNEKSQSPHALESILYKILEDLVHFNNVLFIEFANHRFPPTPHMYWQ